MEDEPVLGERRRSREQSGSFIKRAVVAVVNSMGAGGSGRSSAGGSRVGDNDDSSSGSRRSNLSDEASLRLINWQEQHGLRLEELFCLLIRGGLLCNKLRVYFKTKDPHCEDIELCFINAALTRHICIRLEKILNLNNIPHKAFTEQKAVNREELSARPITNDISTAQYFTDSYAIFVQCYKSSVGLRTILQETKNDYLSGKLNLFLAILNYIITKIKKQMKSHNLAIPAVPEHNPVSNPQQIDPTTWRNLLHPDDNGEAF